MYDHTRINAIRSSYFDILYNVAAITTIHQSHFSSSHFCHQFLQPLLPFHVKPDPFQGPYLK
jgi:hypothetical protein